MLIFDFDGTLVKSSELVYELWRRIAEKFGYSLTKEEFRKTINPDWQKYIKEQFRENWKKHILMLRKNFRWYQKEVAKLRIPKEIVDYLKENEFGIVSSSFKKAILEQIMTEGLEPKFVYTSDSLGVSSKYELLKCALKEGNIKGEDSIYICDMEQDIEAARKLKIKSIAVTWGFHDKYKLKNADAVVNTEKELIKKIKNFTNQKSQAGLSEG